MFLHKRERARSAAKQAGAGAGAGAGAASALRFLTCSALRLFFSLLSLRKPARLESKTSSVEELLVESSSAAVLLPKHGYLTMRWKGL